MRDHGPWKIRRSEEVYRDPWIAVRRDDVVRPDGRDGSHCFIHLKPGVSVLAIDSAGFVHLTDEFHYAIGRRGIEAVSGGIEAGEAADEAARRELEEELGLRARRWHHAGTLDPFTSIVYSPTELYLASDLIPGQVAPEGTERICPVRLPLAEAIDWVMDGRITHAPTCVLLLKAPRLLGLSS